MSVEDFIHGSEVVDVDSGARTIRTVRKSIIHITGTAPDADPLVFPLNKNVLIAGSRSMGARLDMTGMSKGSLPRSVSHMLDQIGAVIIVTRVEEGAGADYEAKLKSSIPKVIGGVDVNTDAYTGVYCALGAQSDMGYAPGIVIAPGHTHQQDVDPDDATKLLLNPVSAAITTIVERIKGMHFKDAPGTTDAAAVKDAGSWDSKRFHLCEGSVIVDHPKVGYIKVFSSATWAGLTAKSDNDRGYWWSPSNQSINNIVGVTRNVDFVNGDPNCRANLLNSSNVNVIINLNGFRTWGNRTLSSDSKWAFTCVVRTADVIGDSLQAAHLWAIDRAMDAKYFDLVVEGLRAFLRHQEEAGAILGGDAWFDPEVNTADQIKQGKAGFDFEFTPVFPSEHVTFRQHIVDTYISNLFTAYSARQTVVGASMTSA